jgi:hypothetical protein
MAGRGTLWRHLRHAAEHWFSHAAAAAAAAAGAALLMTYPAGASAWQRRWASDFPLAMACSRALL